MGRLRLGLVGAFTMLSLAPALAQDPITYQDETATRLVVAPQFGVIDAEEKDYAWADVDQDGDIDLVCVRKQPWNTPGRRRNVFFMNEGIAEGHAVNGVLVDRSLEFVSAATDGGDGFLDLTNDRDIALIDVDGDGWLDMVTSTTYGAGLSKSISHPRVYRNLGNDPSGVWQGYLYEEPRTPTMPIPPHFCGVGHGDVTGDGLPDLYFVDYMNDLEDRLWINDGTGTYVDETSLRMTPEMLDSDFGVHSVIADMNDDGLADIVKDRALSAPIRISIAYNDPLAAGFFSDFETVYLGSSYHVEVGDLNNDGLNDIVIDDDGIDRYLLNQGNGTDGLANFVQHTFPPESDSFGGNIVIRDLDRDGWNDVLIADVDVDCCGCSRHMHLWRNQGNPPDVTFVEMTGGIPIAARTGTHDVAVFDLNGDQWLDLVIGTCTGMSVWIAEPPLDVLFSYPQGVPDRIDPDVPTDLLVDVEVIGSAQGLASVTLFTSLDGLPFVPQSMTSLGGTLYSGSLPGAGCGSTVAFHVRATPTEGGLFFDPINAPAENRSVPVAVDFSTVFTQDFEGAVSDWTVESDSSVTGGAWEIAIPNGTTWDGSLAAPDSDAGDGTDVRAFVTENGPPGGITTSFDVDGGPTRLVSPAIILGGDDAVIFFEAWATSVLGVTDPLTVEASFNGGQSWVSVMSIPNTQGQWLSHSFRASDHLPPSSTVRVRFSLSDDPNDSISEAGIDEFRVVRTSCGGVTLVRGDCNDDGAFDISDPVILLARLFSGGTGTNCDDACDANDDGALDIADVIGMLGAQFGGGPAPPQPHPGCGTDDTADPLGCDVFGSCP